MDTFDSATFTASDGTALTSYTGEVGGAWAALTGSDTVPVIYGDILFTLGGTGAICYAPGVPSGPDYTVSGDYENGSGSNAGQIGLCARIDTTQPFSTATC